MAAALWEEEIIQHIIFDAGCIDLFEITQDLVKNPDQIRSHVSTKVLLDYLMLQSSDSRDKGNKAFI